MAAKVRSLFLVSPFTAFFAFVWHLWLTLSVSSCTMLLQEVSQICLALRYKRYKDDYLAHAIYGFRSLVVSAVVCIWACRERCKTGLWLQAFVWFLAWLHAGAINAQTHQLTNSKTYPFTNVSTHKLKNSPTHQLLNSQPHDLASSQPCQLKNSPTHQLTTSPTSQPTSPPTYQLLNSPTNKLADLNLYNNSLFFSPF